MTTIQEGLEDTETFLRELDERRKFILDHVVHEAYQQDPLEDRGGSKSAIREALEAIDRLSEMILVTRVAINKARANTDVTVSKTTKTVEEWLIWRKELSIGALSFVEYLAEKVRNAREWGDDFLVNLDEEELAQMEKDLLETLGELDGKLSVIYATTDI